MTGRMAFGWALLIGGIMGTAVAVAVGGPIPIGSVVGSKNATLDGYMPLAHTTLLSGDNLKVDDGLAMVALNRGNRMVLGQGTDASFFQKADGMTVSLIRGSVSIYHPASSPVFRVTVEDLTVKPARSRRTRGEILVAGGLLMVTAKDGALLVKKAGMTKEVRKGRTMTIPTVPAQSAGPAPSRDLHIRHIIVQKSLDVSKVAAGGGSTALAAIALTRSPKQVSPVTPAP